MADQSAAQDAVLAFLGRAATHTAPVHRIDTHASVVFLAGERVLKIKRAVRLPYLDYSTLEKRRAACEAELEISRPYAPQIYRRVVPITKDQNGQLTIGGTGVPVEWVVEMARFDEDQTLDKIALARPIDEDCAIEIADAIVKSQERATRSQARWFDTIPLLIARNTERFRSVKQISASEIDQIDQLSLAAFARVRALLEKRTAAGLVRRCHGDLHLANIALIDGHPTLFDAIEFDPAMATTDILYDLAFPVMDLIRFGRGTAAAHLFNRYLTAAGDCAIEGLAALPLFMSMRAAIRANVLFTRYQQSSDDDAFRNARRYLELARELIDPPAPRLVAVGGLSGTGKSMLAKMLAGDVRPRPGAVVLRSDVIRKKLFDVDETTPLPPTAYQPSVSNDVYRILTKTAAHVLAQGCSVIADAAFLRETERDAIAKVVSERRLNFTGLFLSAKLTERLERVRARENDASDANAEVARLQEHYDIGALGCWETVDASGTPQQTLEHALAGLRQPER